MRPIRLLPRSYRSWRRIYAGLSLLLFFWLLWVTDYGRMRGYETSLLLELDPLTAITTFLAGGTLYKGLVISLLLVVGTLYLGRFFCSWICPLGILNQLFGWLFHGLRPSEQYALNRYRPLYRLKYYLLAVLVVLALFGSLQIGLLDPIALMVRSFTTSLLPGLNHSGVPIYLNQPIFSGGAIIGLTLIAILLATRFIPRFWCRTLCPLGALLGVLSRHAPLRIQRDVELCIDCDKCLAGCQGASDPHRELRISECHLCMNCIEACPTRAIHFGLPKRRSSVHLPLDINRRRMVEVGVAAALSFPMLRSSMASHSTPDHRVIRPPGSLAEEAFLASCIKCAACMRVCPTNVLQPAMLEAGLEGIWTPILINRLGYCEQNCVLCGAVCPTGAIRAIPVEEKLGVAPYEEPLRLGRAFYDHGRCLPWSMHVECIVCEEVCPTSPKAIWYKKVTLKARDGSQKMLKQPYVEPLLCIGCGICENKCPVEDLPAIRVSSVGESRSTFNRMILKT